MALPPASMTMRVLSSGFSCRRCEAVISERRRAAASAVYHSSRRLAAGMARAASRAEVDVADADALEIEGQEAREDQPGNRAIRHLEWR